MHGEATLAHNARPQRPHLLLRGGGNVVVTRLVADQHVVVVQRKAACDGRLGGEADEEAVLVDQEGGVNTGLDGVNVERREGRARLVLGADDRRDGIRTRRAAAVRALEGQLGAGEGLREGELTWRRRGKGARWEMGMVDSG